MALLACSMIYNSALVSAKQVCEDVAFMPHEVMTTKALESANNFTDVHIFQRYFTYQVPDERTLGFDQTMQMKFKPNEAPWKKGSGSSYNSYGGDLIMRLRAEFRSAYMDTIDQAMVVEVIEEGTNRVIAKASTVEDDERALRLDSTEMSSDKSYIFRYHFYCPYQYLIYFWLIFR